MMASDRSGIRTAWRKHDRNWGGNRYVYAVVSRRSGGISIGINLNPGKGCNFNCIYCQVDRISPPAVRKVDLGIVEQELYRLLESERNGELYETSLRSDGRRFSRDSRHSFRRRRAYDLR